MGREDGKKGGKQANNPVVVTELGRDNRQIVVPAKSTGNGSTINLADDDVAVLDLTTSGSGASSGGKKNNNATKNSSNNKKSNKNNSKTVELDEDGDTDIEEEEVLSDITYSDDSDDPSWGSRNKKKNQNQKNDPKGKKKSNT